ncbi:MAG: tRNA (adenosine(37)-N6)-threonylcarbamoyltransferase complex dimerization subunit type 1 TsaB, partial [Melioribacteraceae bacterium]|nr:tRNA (adenosine(37)-N6)-threonylcarbamoyltransferase complex dimerization subunit type 1 TsaB [Melioribacteraceae bacterium]
MNQKENLELKSMDEFLPILAIETSSRICSVSLYISDNLYSEFSVNQKNIHSEKLFELINQTLESLEYSFDQIKAIAVSIGPGSFTGLRIGVSAAKGLAFGRKIPIIPVPTFEALALQISNYLSKSTEFTICNSVNRDELYKSDFIS